MMLLKMVAKTLFGNIINAIGVISPEFGYKCSAGNSGVVSITGNYILSFLIISGRLKLFFAYFISTGFWKS